MKVLLYCTKAKPFLFEVTENDNQVLYVTTRLGNADNWRINHKKILNGRIVAMCDIETEEIKLSEYPYSDDCSITLLDTDTLTNDELLYESCLYDYELDDYLIGQKGYALHIKNLKIFDKPKELYEYNTIKAPQNMMRVYDANRNKYILISVQSEWLCKILNGEKTIEVRKKVLKEML